MNRRTEIVCMWCMPVGLVLLLIGLLISGYLPPPSNTMSPHAFQQFTIDHANGMRLGVTLMAFAGIFTIPMMVVVTIEMMRIEGKWGPLALTQLGCAICSGVAFFVPLFPLAAAAYRPHSDPQILRMLNDMFWVPYVIAIWPFVGQSVVLGILTKRKNALPGWFAWVCSLDIIGIAITVPDLWHLNGPLADTGLVGLWIPFVIVFVWWLSTFAVFLKLVSKRGEDEDADGFLAADVDQLAIEQEFRVHATPVGG